MVAPVVADIDSTIQRLRATQKFMVNYGRAKILLKLFRWWLCHHERFPRWWEFPYNAFLALYTETLTIMVQAFLVARGYPTRARCEDPSTWIPAADVEFLRTIVVLLYATQHVYAFIRFPVEEFVALFEPKLKACIETFGACSTEVASVAAREFSQLLIQVRTGSRVRVCIPEALSDKITMEIEAAFLLNDMSASSDSPRTFLVTRPRWYCPTAVEGINPDDHIPPFPEAVELFEQLRTWCTVNGLTPVVAGPEPLPPSP